MSWNFRKITLEDSELVLSWRNNPEIYKYFFNPGPVALENHTKWMEKIVKSKDVLFLIALHNGVPAGTVRYDLNSEATEAEVGIYLAPEFHGKGLGVSMLENSEAEAKKEFKTLKKIIAKVLVENIASEKMFVKAGYDKHFIQLEKNMEK